MIVELLRFALSILKGRLNKLAKLLNRLEAAVEAAVFGCVDKGSMLLLALPLFVDDDDDDDAIVGKTELLIKGAVIDDAIDEAVCVDCTL